MAIKRTRIECVFWHLKSHNVFPGDQVKAGDLIALSDNTGYSEGPHLHFQVNLTNEHGMSGQAIDPINSFVWDTDMTAEEVKLHYVLAFYREPTAEELTFWTGKQSIDFLKQAIHDRGVFLTSIVSV